MMMLFPQPNPREFEFKADIKLKEQKRIQDLNGYTEKTSRLSRTAYVLILLTIMLLIVVGMVILYHFFH